MTPNQAESALSRMLDTTGETIAIRRYLGTGPNRPYVDYSARARISDTPQTALVGEVYQGNRKVIVSARDLFAAQLPGKILTSDIVVIGDQEHSIESIDDGTRRIKGELIGYNLMVRA